MVFIGTTGYGVPEHTRRYEILDYLCRNTDIKIFSNEMKEFQYSKINLWIHTKVILTKITSFFPTVILEKLAKYCHKKSDRLFNLFNWAGTPSELKQINTSQLNQLKQFKKMSSRRDPPVTIFLNCFN